MEKMDSIDWFLNYRNNIQKDEVLKFHQDFEPWMHQAKGSSHNHQAWEGGYYDHVNCCLALATDLYAFQTGFKSFSFPPLSQYLDINSVTRVLYFHDIEKIFKYTDHPDGDVWLDYDDSIDPNGKWKWIGSLLDNLYHISFNEDELNALNYIHGEGSHYSKTQRVMNPLAAFCHSVDVMVARIYHNFPNSETKV